MQGKITVKYNFYTVFLVTFVVNATWLDITLLNIYNSTEKTVTKLWPKTENNPKKMLNA